MFAASNGDALIYGHSLKNMDTIRCVRRARPRSIPLATRAVVTEHPASRRSLGVCPQHDVIFPTLTVLEHLQFFALVKGMDDADVEGAIQELVSVRHRAAGWLAGWRAGGRAGGWAGERGCRSRTPPAGPSADRKAQRARRHALRCGMRRRRCAMHARRRRARRCARR